MRVVIPSVDYADMLAVNLPAWLTVLPADAEVRVVTSPKDAATIRTALELGVAVVETEAWSTPRGAVFNKAAALDVAFGFTGIGAPPSDGEWCLSLDADVYPARMAWPSDLGETQLYGCARYLCPTTNILADVQAGRVAVASLDCRNGGHRGAGYFQLFHYRPGLSFGSFPTAGHYDLAFHQHFSAVVDLAECAVLHLGRTNSKNWMGRRVMPAWGAHG